MNKAIALIRSAVAQSDNLMDFDAFIREDAFNANLFLDRDRFVVRASAKVGQSVKVGSAGEYFWVEIVDRTDAGVFVGRVDNDLRQTEMHGLKRDDIVVFGPEHIRVVENDERFPAPVVFDKPLIMLIPMGKSVTNPDEEVGSALTGMKYADPMGGEYMTVEEFRQGIEDTSLTDDDGFAYAVGRGGDIACTSETFTPSQVERLPEGTSHIIWFNK